MRARSLRLRSQRAFLARYLSAPVGTMLLGAIVGWAWGAGWTAVAAVAAATVDAGDILAVRHA